MLSAKLRFVLLLGLLTTGLMIGQCAATAAPANDNFANATAISGKPSSITGTNVGATKEAGEPNPGDSYGDSVWYRWKAPTSGGVTFTATGAFNSELGIYTGLYVASLTRQTEFQPGLGTATSSATFNAVAGTTYSILVDDYYGDTGNFTLTWLY